MVSRFVNCERIFSSLFPTSFHSPARPFFISSLNYIMCIYVMSKIFVYTNNGEWMYIATNY